MERSDSEDVAASASRAERASSDSPRIRASAKVIVLDRDYRTLLFRGGDPRRPAAGTWWFPPGGGVEAGETLEQAAWRELREETGIRGGKLLGPVMRRQATFEFDGVEYDSDESYFVLLTDAVVIDVSDQTQREREVIAEHRWWSSDELLTTAETVYPEGLAQLVRRISAQP